MGRRYDYTGVRSERLWAGESGRKVRAASDAAQAMYCYLLTCPSRSMIGLYPLVLPTAAHERGRTVEEVKTALLELEPLDLAHYAEDEERVWVPDLALHDIGDTLEPGDTRRVLIVKECERAKDSRFYADFLARYDERYRLTRPPPLLPPAPGDEGKRRRRAPPPAPLPGTSVAPLLPNPSLSLPSPTQPIPSLPRPIDGASMPPASSSDAPSMPHPSFGDEAGEAARSRFMPPRARDLWHRMKPLARVEDEVSFWKWCASWLNHNRPAEAWTEDDWRNLEKAHADYRMAHDKYGVPRGDRGSESSPSPSPEDAK